MYTLTPPKISCQKLQLYIFSSRWFFYDWTCSHSCFDNLHLKKTEDTVLNKR